MIAVLALPLTNFAQKVPSPPAPGSAFYSFQHPEHPPLPFNLFPELPFYEIESKVYVIDDRSVDYSSSLMMTASGGPPVPGPRGGQPQPPPILPPHTSTLGLTSLWVNISLNPPTNLFLDVFNTTPGVQYGVGAKNSIDPDPFNTWSLVNVFEATANTQRLSAAAAAPIRFYRAINLDEYDGPRVEIVSPAPGSTVSGDVPLEIAVNDVFPLASVDVFVGPMLAGSIRPGQGGRITIPSYWFPNGAQEIWVRVVNEGALADADSDGVADNPLPIQSWASVPVTFANEVYMTSYSPLYSAFGYFTMDYVTTTPHNYTFEVFKLTGELLHTQSGASSGGNINPQWNFTNLSGQPVDDGGYVFSLTASPQGGGAAAAAGSKLIITSNFFDKGVTVAKYVISYGTFDRQSLNNWLETLNNAVSTSANMAAFFDEDIIGPSREAHGTIRADSSSVPYAIRTTTQTADFAALTNALADPDTGSWLWEGHAGILYVGPGSGTGITNRLYAADVASLLGNTLSFPNPTNLFYNRRLHATINTGCGTVNGFFPGATGTPLGVQQEGNPWIKKSAFVGFAANSQAGETKTGWTIRIHDVWIDGVDYDTPLNTGVDIANLYFPDAQAWGPAVRGYRYLSYNGEESR
jgi:hypothetical protein